MKIGQTASEPAKPVEEETKPEPETKPVKRKLTGGPIPRGAWTSPPGIQTKVDPIPRDALAWVIKSMKDRYGHHVPKCPCGEKKPRVFTRHEKLPDYFDVSCPCGIVTIWYPSPSWIFILTLEEWLKKV